MIDWNRINTVLLDMDGTLLDLYFDNYFWQEYLPVQWGKHNGFDEVAAKEKLLPEFKSREGTLNWYCLDFWSSNLQLDVMELKAGVEHLIKLRPSALHLLEALVKMEKKPVMVTNAHPSLIDMKMQKTGIDVYFQQIINSHSIGAAKEDLRFWSSLQNIIKFDPAHTLLIDDNLAVLRTARDCGIAHLYSIARPDSSQPEKDSEEFTAIEDFRDILPLMVDS